MTGLSRWNALPGPDAERELLSCCASPAWAARLAARRPYPDLPALLAAADGVLDDLEWPQVEAALTAHPRIGARLAAGGGRAADWSRREQAGAQDADAATTEALVRANQEYEQRFGHVFLVFATGRSAAELLAAARERLAHAPQTEQRVVRAELAKITTLRLERLLAA